MLGNGSHPIHDDAPLSAWIRYGHRQHTSVCAVAQPHCLCHEGAPGVPATRLLPPAIAAREPRRPRAFWFGGISLTLMSVKLLPMLPGVQRGTAGLAGQWAYNVSYCLILFLPLGSSPPFKPSPRRRGEHTTGGQDDGVHDHLW